MRGIGLVKVTWKVVAVILHRRLTTGIKPHDALHGFREGRGIGTATLLFRQPPSFGRREPPF